MSSPFIAFKGSVIAEWRDLLLKAWTPVEKYICIWSLTIHFLKIQQMFVFYLYFLSVRVIDDACCLYNLVSNFEYKYKQISSKYKSFHLSPLRSIENSHKNISNLFPLVQNIDKSGAAWKFHHFESIKRKLSYIFFLFFILEHTFSWKYLK